MNDEPTEESKGIGQKIKLGLKSGLVLIAAATLLAASARMRGKIDLAEIRQRFQPGKRLLYKSNGDASSIHDVEGQEEETSASAGHHEDGASQTGQQRSEIATPQPH